MVLQISTTKNQIKQKNYIFEVIFKEFLGLNYHINTKTEGDFLLSSTINKNSINLPDCFFRNSESNWLHVNTSPQLPLNSFNVRSLPFPCTITEQTIPVIYGSLLNSKKTQKDRFHIPIDIFGSCFFMLTRYEELINSERDSHDRFASKSSLAFKEGFIDRPIVDEYVEIMWSCINWLWPNIRRKEKKIQLNVTCDVDHPWVSKPSWKNITKSFLYNIYTRKTTKFTLRDLSNKYKFRKGNVSFDKHMAKIDWMMDVNEKQNNTVSFYFAGGGKSKLDPKYSLDNPLIKNLIQRINERGHEIGLHPSYETYKNKNKTLQESLKLRGILKELNITQKVYGGRQHYLRWESPTTAYNWSHSGMAYDSSLGFADHCGFRCGTSQTFPMFDPKLLINLNIKQKPLIVMDCTAIEQKYMGLGITIECNDYIQMLKKRALTIGREFTLLWHNSYFENSFVDKMYLQLINRTNYKNL
ncbi:polysaccharide deacetylase family protein [Verrucomicrobia bacterium]|nr:polysaccharide deacetylase family protein [Verrucomicrobiota bacterium]